LASRASALEAGVDEIVLDDSDFAIMKARRPPMLPEAFAAMGGRAASADAEPGHSGRGVSRSMVS
jgi:hypothetical protein